jgi:hypothetical protein
MAYVSHKSTGKNYPNVKHLNNKTPPPIFQKIHSLRVKLRYTTRRDTLPK